MKICLVGAGSFVFAPSVLHDAILEERLPQLHLALIDPNLELAGLMAGVGRQMAQEAGQAVQLSTHAAWDEALAGADFVVCCAAIALQRRFATDLEIIRRHSPTHLVTEFGGVQGISYTLRQIALIEKLARAMRQHCPAAWLLCSSNPLPRVCQAAHALGIRSAGFCSNSLGGYGLIGRVRHGWQEEYPWPLASARYEATMAGLNHITFTLALRDRTTGREVLPEFIAELRRQDALSPLTAGLLAQTACWPANGDGHMQDFLPPAPGAKSLELSSHGNAAEREARLAQLRQAAAGEAPWLPLLAHRSWEKPMAFVAGLAGLRQAEFHSLNLANDGQIPNLPAGVFVETPAAADARGPQPRRLELPPAVANLSRPMAELNALLVQAALTRRRSLAHDAVELDPTILDKAGAHAALDACLEAHQDLIGPRV